MFLWMDKKRSCWFQSWSVLILQISMKGLFICFYIVAITVQAYSQHVVNMKEYGIAGGMDVTPVVQEILKKSEQHAVKIIFPKGTYHFYPDKALGKYHAVTNHDNLFRYFAFPLINCTHVEIDGGGSDFIFHGVIQPFLVENSTSVTLKNFSVDWEEPFNLQAEVLDRNIREQTMDIKVHPMNKALFEGNRLGFLTNGRHLLFLGESMVFDPATKAVAYNAKKYVLNSVTSRSTFDQDLGNDVFRVKAKFAVEPPLKGLLYVSKGPNGFNRLTPAIHLSGSKDVVLQDITIHHAGGMGVIAEKTENIHLNRLNVKLREGTERILTTTADATHFCNCKGNLLIENCLFENMLDDAANIHGVYVKISEIVNEHTLRADINHFQQFDFDFAESGDEVQFIDRETMLPVSQAKVKSIRKINDHLFELAFVEKLPAGLKVNDAVDNISWYPSVIFRNNNIRNNRARGILISTRNKVRIYNNMFSSMMTSILFEGDLNNWYESGAVQDVEIRNNLFLDNVYGGLKGSVIWINPRMKKIVDDTPFEKNIIIEDNEFRTFDNSILSALSVGGLVFRNNKLIESYTYPKLFGERPAIEVNSCPNAIIRGNTYTGKEPARIMVDESSLKTLSMDKEQKGFVYSY